MSNESILLNLKKTLVNDMIHSLDAVGLTWDYILPAKFGATYHA